MNLYIVTFENGARYNVRAKSVDALATAFRELGITLNKSIQSGWLGGERAYSPSELAALLNYIEYPDEDITACPTCGLRQRAAMRCRNCNDSLCL